MHFWLLKLFQSSQPLYCYSWCPFHHGYVYTQELVRQWRISFSGESWRKVLFSIRYKTYTTKYTFLRSSHLCSSICHLQLPSILCYSSPLILFRPERNHVVLVIIKDPTVRMHHVRHQIALAVSIFFVVVVVVVNQTLTPDGHDDRVLITETHG